MNTVVFSQGAPGNRGGIGAVGNVGAPVSSCGDCVLFQNDNCLMIGHDLIFVVPFCPVLLNCLFSDNNLSVSVSY